MPSEGATYIWSYPVSHEIVHYSCLKKAFLSKELQMNEVVILKFSDFNRHGFLLHDKPWSIGHYSAKCYVYLVVKRSCLKDAVTFSNGSACQKKIQLM